MMRGKLLISIYLEKKSSFHNYISNVILAVKINKTKKQVGTMPNHGQCVSVFLVGVILVN